MTYLAARKKVPSPQLTLYILLAFGVIMPFVAYFHDAVSLAVAGSVVGVAFGFAFPSLAGFVAQQTSIQERGTAYGFFVTGNDLGQVAGAIGMGFFVDKVGYEAVFSAVGVATLLFGAFYGFFLMP